MAGQQSQETARLLALGVSHHHAPLEVRERLYLQDGQGAELAEALGEAVVLSTCNRTEVYLVGGDPERAREQLEQRSGLELDGVLARWDDGEAVSHLFRVAAGLDSLVPGESQILGQVRDAYEAARTPRRHRRVAEPALRGRAARRQARPHRGEAARAARVGRGLRGRARSQ